MSSILHQLLVNIVKPLAKIISSRDRGLKTETAFWDRWFSTKGDQWPDDYIFRISADSPVGEWHGKVLDSIESYEIKVLDVGAGPITSFGYKYKGKKIRLFPVDPLARQYEILIKKYGVEPPVKTLGCCGEHLHTYFQNDQFDLVNARNSLDHSVDPLECIRSMYAVCRVKGYLTLIHAENEALNNCYAGLHQWNFSLVNGQLHIQGDNYNKCIDNEFGCRIVWHHEIKGGVIYSSGHKVE